ncbi:methyl-accepting chemotaxis protein [Candidatus Magnetaquicoccus inordinatus]|uniref:methyl-accepting chemotaxis protein n=1 Tax=Candidatus Magnetaquicoccus inordinatus TaxID=2496818 RepID=UPI00102B98CE|nr:methyl-accepting chemotaxis protein [Candidatus Magnetaquicoccus inordinatus]
MKGMAMSASRVVPGVHRSQSISAPTPFHDFPKEKFFRLRKTVPFLLPTLIAAPAIAVILIAYSMAMNNIHTLSHDTLQQGSNKVMDRITAFLDAAAYTVAINATFIAAERSDHDFKSAFANLSETEIKRHPYFRLIYFGDMQGNHLLHKVEENGSVRMRVIERLNDAQESRQRFNEAVALAERGEHGEQIERLLASVLKTTWWQKDAGGQLSMQGQDRRKIYDPRLRPWFQKASSSKTIHWTDVYAWEEQYQSAQRWESGITVSYPVEKKGELLGVTAIDIVLQDIVQFLQGLSLSANSRIAIFDEQGMLVASSDREQPVVTLQSGGSTPQRVAMMQLKDPALLEAYRQWLEKRSRAVPASETNDHMHHFQHQKEAYLSHIQPLVPQFGLRWQLLVLAPEADFTAETTHMLMWSMLFALLLLLPLAYIGIKLGYLLTAPINHVIQDMKRLVQNDLRPGREGVTRIQEFGFLSFLFAKMRSSLHAMIGDISSRSQVLEQSVQSLTSESERVSSGIQVASSAIEQVTTLSEGANRNMHDVALMMEEMEGEMKNVIREMRVMSDDMGEISESSRVYCANLEELSTSSHHARSNLDLLGSAVQEASQEVSDATRAVGEISDALLHIRQQCDRTAEETEHGRREADAGLQLIDNLAKSLVKIEDIIEFINDVADQIDILSFNARIEASSAGDLGQGFAVVANEVRDLSQHTARSAGTIAESALELKENFQEVSHFMQDMSVRMKTLNLHNQEIMSAVAVQTVSIDNIRQTMEQLNNKTEQIALRMTGSLEGVGSVSATVRELAQSIAEVTQHIVKATEDVGRMAPLIDQTTRQSWDMFMRVEETARSSNGINSEMAVVRQMIDDLQQLDGQVRNRADYLAGMASQMKEEVSVFHI